MFRVRVLRDYLKQVFHSVGSKL